MYLTFLVSTTIVTDINVRPLPRGISYLFEINGHIYWKFDIRPSRGEAVKYFESAMGLIADEKFFTV